MIIANITVVNTSSTGGGIELLNEMFVSEEINEPQFISCQHHVLDRVAWNKYNFIK